MAELKNFRVNRRLDGDKLYEDGDHRLMLPAEAQPLVDTGALTLIGDAPATETPAPAPVTAPTPAVTLSSLAAPAGTATPPVATKAGRKA